MEYTLEHFPEERNEFWIVGDKEIYVAETNNQPDGELVVRALNKLEPVYPTWNSTHDAIKAVFDDCEERRGINTADAREQYAKLQTDHAALLNAAREVAANSTKWTGNLLGTHYYTVSGQAFDALAAALPERTEQEPE